MEIIDGRQRIETIIKFLNNEFKLRMYGLDVLKDLDKKNYDDLPINIRILFKEYKIKIILYKVNSLETINLEELEYVKRNLFRKYNSGMTALTGREIARAKYLYDPLTIYISDKLEKDEVLLNKCTDVLVSKTKRDIPIRERINIILVNIREMLTVTYISVVNVNTVKLGIKVIDLYYQNFIAPLDPKDKCEEFFTIFEKIVKLKELMIKDNFLLMDNILFVKSIYWMLSLIYVQYDREFYNFDIAKFYRYLKNEGKAMEYFDANKNIKSEHIINRYKYVKKYLDLTINIELKNKIDNYLDSILDNKRKVKYKLSKISKDEVWYGINPDSKLKTHIERITVEEIIRLIQMNRFIIRSEYQREEIKSKVKASRIIESILLGIKIPPIYALVETGQDYLDKYTVIDGQQRLISIISYIGEVILDGKEGMIKTYKNKYRLTGLRDIPSLENYIFDNDNSKINDPILKDFRLDASKKEKILKYEIEIIMIDKKLNPNFKAVDMFLRMNQSPCNISENSFEMWNSFDNIKTINRIKEISKYDLLKQYGNRMKEEELITVLAYMDYKKINIDNFTKFLRIYLFTENKDKSNEKLEIKLSVNNKQSITDYLEKMEPGSIEEVRFNKSIDNVANFINKLKELTANDSSLLIKIFNPYIDVPRKSNMKDLYIMWLIFNDIDVHIIKTYCDEILRDLKTLFAIMKNMDNSKNEIDFINYMKSIKDKYIK